MIDKTTVLAMRVRGGDLKGGERQGPMGHDAMIDNTAVLAMRVRGGDLKGGGGQGLMGHDAITDKATVLAMRVGAWEGKGRTAMKGGEATIDGNTTCMHDG